jgi:type IV secretory pathway protease TraF
MFSVFLKIPTLGDNSLASYDSRYWGPLPVADLRGVVWLVYFPPRAWRSFPRH